MKLIRPFKSDGNAQAYQQHRERLRFLYVLGQGIKQVDTTLNRGFEGVHRDLEGVQENQRQIHGALLTQTRVIREGLFDIELSLEQGFDQVAEKLEENTAAAHQINDTLLFSTEQMMQGMAGMKAAFDMGVADIVSQFELQRNEIQEGFEKLVNLMQNNRKTEARERYLDGKQAFEQFQQFPDEPQFLTDAHDYLQESVRIYRGNPFCHLYLGHIYQEPSALYDLEKSLQHYQLVATYAKGLENNQMTALGYFLSAWISYVVGELDAAIEQAEKVLQYDPEGLPENYYNLARYYAGKQLPNEALKYLDTAVQQYDPLYTVKADIDQEFNLIRPQLDQYFLDIREAAAKQWDQRLEGFQLLGPDDSHSE